MKKSKKNYLPALITTLILTLPQQLQAGWLPSSHEAKQPATTTREEASPALRATSSGLYDVIPKPLTVAQCGQCHPAVFKMIRENGTKHKIDCALCHTKLHSYTPNKPNWDKIMPQCSQCHTLPHGKPFADCTICHIVPHTPKRVPMIERMTTSCGTCHTGPSREMSQFPSKHSTEVTCQECHHDRHGLIPSCMECHEPHLACQQVAECLACHPVHKPLSITYGPADSPTCGTCHDGVYSAWIETTSKHGQVACSDCHEQHGQIPDCAECHETPHDEKLMTKFPKCLDCHIDAHDLPME